MKRFDGMYGKLVKDWSMDEWTRFYHDHYVTLMLECGWETGDWEKRLFCGPYLTDEEISKYVKCEPSTFSDDFDAPLSIYREDDLYRCELSNEERASEHKRYCENYPWPPVADDVVTRLPKLIGKAIQTSFNSPLSEYVESMNETDAKNHLEQNVWVQRRGYCGTVERVNNGREYAYLVAKYPSLRNENCDDYWAADEGYTRFHQQYVDQFAKLNKHLEAA